MKEKKCLRCNNFFEIDRYNAKKKFCDRNCWYNFNHVKKTAEEGWTKIRLHILERDNYTCQECGKKATDVHHIDGTGSNRPTCKMNNNYDNLVSLCHKCHIIIEYKKKKFSNSNFIDVRRNNFIILSANFYSQTELSRIFGLSRQRINEIIKKKTIIKIDNPC
jgi:hypothetical protein